MGRKKRKSIYNPSTFKCTRVSDYKEGKRWSFKQKFDEPFNDENCGEEGYTSLDYRNESDYKFGENSKVYSPDQIYNYKSQYARYERSLDLIPSRIIPSENGNAITYQYKSCNSPSGFWTVKVLKGGISYLTAGKSLLWILPYPLDLQQLDDEKGKIKSDGSPDSFEWVFVKGNRDVISMPNTSLNPVLLFANTNFLPNSNPKSFPIVLRISSVEDPTIFDFLIVFTVPVAYFYYASIGGGSNEKPLDAAFTPNPRFDINEIPVTISIPERRKKWLVDIDIFNSNLGEYIFQEKIYLNNKEFFSTKNQTYRIVGNSLGYGIRTEKLVSYYKLNIKNGTMFGETEYHQTSIGGGKSSFVSKPRISKPKDYNQIFSLSSSISGGKINFLIKPRISKPRNYIQIFNSSLSIGGGKTNFSVEPKSGIIVK